MPLYDYQCNHCHTRTSALRSISSRHDAFSCTACEMGEMQYQISAPRSIAMGASAFRAATPQQQLAGPDVQGPGTRPGIRSSVLHQCSGPGCNVCA